FMLDADGRLASWNAGAQRILGYELHEIVGQHFSRFYPREDVERKKPQWELEVAAAEGRFEEEGCRVRTGGASYRANLTTARRHREAPRLRRGGARSHRAQAGRGRADPRQGGGRTGERGEVAVPRQHVARAAHAAQQPADPRAAARRQRRRQPEPEAGAVRA